MRASAHPRDAGGSVPPGWGHNPTSRRRRAMLAVLAGAGLAIALYLTLFQFDAWDEVWDPWFASRTVLELTSPMPDALAGVLAYGAELLLPALGGRDRWRSLPWACLALGAVLTGGAVVSIALIVIQPTVAGAWCTLCLGSAAISLALFAFGIGEARAAWQEIRRSVARGSSFGDAFWGPCCGRIAAGRDDGDPRRAETAQATGMAGGGDARLRRGPSPP